MPKSQHGYRVLVLGATFKENCPDTRNSKVPDLVRELEAFGTTVTLVDPYAHPAEFFEEYGVDVRNELPKESKYDGVILAVPHKQYLDIVSKMIPTWLTDYCVLVDVKSVLDPLDYVRYTYWSL